MRKIRIEELDAQRLVQEVIAKAITSIGLTPEKLQMEINPNVKLKEEEKIEIAIISFTNVKKKLVGMDLSVEAKMDSM